jgi:hypothetical protein
MADSRSELSCHHVGVVGRCSLILLASLETSVAFEHHNALGYSAQRLNTAGIVMAMVCRKSAETNRRSMFSLFLDRATIVAASLTNSGTEQAYVDLTSSPATLIRRTTTKLRSEMIINGTNAWKSGKRRLRSEIMYDLRQPVRTRASFTPATARTTLHGTTARHRNMTSRHRRIVISFSNLDHTTAWSPDIAKRSDSPSAAQRNPSQHPLLDATLPTAQRTSAISFHGERLASERRRPSFDLGTYTAQHRTRQLAAIFSIVPRAVQASPPKDDIPTSFPQRCWRAAKYHLRTCRPQHSPQALRRLYPPTAPRSCLPTDAHRDARNS